MNITVYCGASAEVDEVFLQAARELGEWIGLQGHTLVYGAGSTGLMGAVACAARDAGASVFGIIPTFLLSYEPPIDGLARLELTEDMATRKARMIELADAFVALPGGPGTLEELSEIVSMIKLGQCASPLIVVNIDGYFDPVHQTYASMLAHGFMDEDSYKAIKWVDTIAETIEFLQEL